MVKKNLDVQLELNYYSKNNSIFIGDNYKIMKDVSFRSQIPIVDFIYIDPPYNTQKKFSYSDKRNHKNWANFMKKRLKLAKDFLHEKGIICISIDDSEYANLKILCDDIFNEKNFVGTFITYQSQRSNSKLINTVHEYVLCFAKNKSLLSPLKVKRMDILEERNIIFSIIRKVKNVFNKFWSIQATLLLWDLIKKYSINKWWSWIKNYNNLDETWRIFFAKDLSTPWKPRKVNIPEINLNLEPLENRWWSSDEKFKRLFKKWLLAFKGSRPYEKHFLEDAENNIWSVLNFYSRQGTNDLKRLGLANLFDTPKPVELIKFLIRIGMSKNWHCFDFFWGSWTTAQAVYELNHEDGGSRTYTLIQLDELIDKWNKIYDTCLKNGIQPNIWEILKYRVKKVLEHLKIDDFNLKIIEKWKIKS